MVCSTENESVARIVAASLPVGLEVVALQHRVQGHLAYSAACPVSRHDVMNELSLPAARPSGSLLAIITRRTVQLKRRVVIRHTERWRRRVAEHD
jgi:hypothetical protein